MTEPTTANADTGGSFAARLVTMVKKDTLPFVFFAAVLGVFGTTLGSFMVDWVERTFARDTYQYKKRIAHAIADAEVVIKLDEGLRQDSEPARRALKHLVCMHAKDGEKSADPNACLSAMGKELTTLLKKIQESNSSQSAQLFASVLYPIEAGLSSSNQTYPDATGRAAKQQDEGLLNATAELSQSEAASLIGQSANKTAAQLANASPTSAISSSVDAPLPRIYIQVADLPARERTEQVLKPKLRKAGVIVPPIEIVTESRIPKTSQVRYCKAELAAIELLKISMKPQDFRFFALPERLCEKSRNNHFELWLTPSDVATLK